MTAIGKARSCHIALTSIVTKVEDMSQGWNNHISKVGEEVGQDWVKSTSGEVGFRKKFGKHYISNGGEAG